jgi:ribosomal protein L37E
MEPTRDTHATLVDLLDRVLDKGLILDADLIIHVAGIPLLGVKLKAALAGMETMLNYGIWKDWDAAQRAIATEEYRRKKGVLLMSGEEVLLKMFASQWYSKGIHHNWRPGHLYATDRRVFLFRKEPAEILFQCFYEEIKGMATARKTNTAGKEANYLYLLLSSGEVAQLHPSDALVVREAIEDRMKALGLGLEENPPFPMLDERAMRFLSDDEEILHSGKMSHLVVEPRTGGTTANVWKPGHLYLTTERLAWWYDFDGKVAFQVPVDKISGIQVRRRDLGGMLKNKLVLDLVYRNGAGNEVGSFSDVVEELNEWHKIISEVMAGCHNGVDADDDTEECHGCGSKAPATKLLKEGCSICGWMSPRLRREEATI